MKKIYSLLLTAAALLVGINAWAGTYNVGTIEDFETYWAKSAEEDVVINLTSNSITLTKTMWLGTQNMNDASHSVTINMNGHILSTSAAYGFLLTHGTLKLTGDGTLNSTSASAVFFVTGSVNKDVDPSVDGANYYSHLEIGEGVRVILTDAYTSVIAVDQMHTGSTAHKAMASIPAKPKLNYITNVYAKKEAETKGAAHGVRIDLKGTIEGTKYGIKTNGDLGNPNYFFEKIDNEGNVKDTVAFPTTLIPAGYTILATDNQYSPYVHIYPTAKITVHDKDDSGNAKTKNPIAIYASGYARWLVEGRAEGCTGATIKSGEIDFINATIIGTGDTYSAATETTSGSTASGSAIVISTSEAYVGDIDVNIGGDSYVAASNGYAIEEQVVASDNQTKVDSITITGGTFQGGQIPNPVDPTQGNIDAVMSVSIPTAVAAASPTDETTITIIGGTSSAGTTTIGEQTLADYLANETTTSQQGQTHLTQVTTENGTIWVISEGEAPAAAEDLTVKEWPEGENASVNWIHESELVTSDMVDEISDVTMAEPYHGGATTFQLRELQMSGNYNQTLTIKDGYTLEVGRVVLGAKAKIIVEAGAKLIVTGNQGIVAPVAGNVILKYDSENKKFANALFNNEVASNRHPNATVEFTSRSWFESASYKQWEWFGIPTFTAAKSIAATCPAFVAVYENNGWSEIGLIEEINADADKLAKLNKPFAAYDLLANRLPSADAPTITITGELVGNIDATLRADKRWNPFANSYTAEIDAEKLVTALSSSENIAAAVYVATHNTDGSIQWDAKAIKPLNKVHGIMLKPMQAFMLHNNRYKEDATINYASMVYAPATSAGAPRRSAENENATIVTINVANENGTWDDVDLCESNAASFEKYLNSDINIYVLADEKNDIFATEDLENTYVGFSTVKGGNFTISFTKAEGREFDLIDLETGAKVAVSEGETYTFNAAANFANDYRFKLVERAKMPTAIENTEVKANVKGIYTITGQYLGEMNVWNTLPAGVYVVNGAKLVK